MPGTSRRSSARPLAPFLIAVRTIVRQRPPSADKLHPRHTCRGAHVLIFSRAVLALTSWSVLSRFQRANNNRAHRDEHLLDWEWLREREDSLRASVLADDSCCNRSMLVNLECCNETLPH